MKVKNQALHWPITDPSSQMIFDNILFIHHQTIFEWTSYSVYIAKALRWAIFYALINWFKHIYTSSSSCMFILPLMYLSDYDAIYACNLNEKQNDTWLLSTNFFPFLWNGHMKLSKSWTDLKVLWSRLKNTCCEL